MKEGIPVLSVHKICLTTMAVICLTLLLSAPWSRAAEQVEEDPLQQLFLEGMMDRAQGNLYDAVAAFNRILSNQPMLHRARLELAVTYYRLYDYDRARKLAQQVLDDPKTPPNVRVSVQAFLAQINKDAKSMQPGHSWKPSISLGWMYDTNVNAGPSSDLFDVGGQIWALNPGSQPKSDNAVIFTAGLNHMYRTGKTARIGQKNAVLLWQSNASYYRRDYSDEHAFDLDIFTVGTGPALIAINNWRANLNIQADYIRQGSNDLAWFVSLLPSFTKQFQNGVWEVTLDGTLTLRDYQQEVDAGRDSTYSSAQLSVGRTFRKVRVSVQAGGSVFKENADIGRFSNDGTDVYAAIGWRPLMNGSVYGRINEKNINYDGLEPVFNVARDERERKYTIGVNYTIKSSKRWLNDLSISGTFVRTNNHSNVAIYDYDRNQVSVMVGKIF